MPKYALAVTKVLDTVDDNGVIDFETEEKPQETSIGCVIYRVPLPSSPTLKFHDVA